MTTRRKIYVGVKLNITVISFFFLLASIGKAQAGVFDVTKYGAKADGRTDLRQALTSAWKEACASTSPSRVVIPKGTYFLTQAKLEGPCKAPIEVNLRGTLKAPAEPSQVKDTCWVTFSYINHFTLSGGGTFDGQGAIAWSQNNCNKNNNCKKPPMNLSFNFITNSIVHDVTTKDSKQFHVNVFGCQNITFLHFTVTAPENSPNTDGIHIGKSHGVNITNSFIGTGDDCISLGDGCKRVTITKVTCGPGHGISIGSLGKYKNEEPVVGVSVSNCTLTNTQNGVRIKTWPDSEVGTISNMHFQDIIMNNVGNPVIIDQVYCPWNRCNPQIPSRVKISNVRFKNIRGTSKTQVAVKLDCSKGIPCQGVEISDINLTYRGPGGPAISECVNVKPTITGKQNPRACTRSA